MSPRVNPNQHTIAPVNGDDDGELIETGRRAIRLMIADGSSGRVMKLSDATLHAIAERLLRRSTVHDVAAWLDDHGFAIAQRNVYRFAAKFRRVMRGLLGDMAPVASSRHVNAAQVLAVIRWLDRQKTPPKLWAKLSVQAKLLAVAAVAGSGDIQHPPGHFKAFIGQQAKQAIHGRAIFMLWNRIGAGLKLNRDLADSRQRHAQDAGSGGIKTDRSKADRSSEKGLDG
jgi:hypothetical protein